MNTKQVIVMRKDLNMRKGKMVAQGAHASMAVLTNNISTAKWALWRGVPCQNTSPKILCMPSNDPVHHWFMNDFTKICVGCDSEEELVEILLAAQKADIPCALIEDNGQTEFGGNKTKTCLALGPWYSEEIDKITGGLRLL